MSNKLAIIGGSGLYDVEEFKDRELIDLKHAMKDSLRMEMARYKDKRRK